MLRLIERTPGDGYLYQVLVVDLSGLSQKDRERIGNAAPGPLYQATLSNWPGRPSLLFSSYVAPYYAAEKMPSLSRQVIEVFCDVLNKDVLNL